MKTVRHWTPHYLVSRLGVLLYEKRHRDHPWLTSQAVWLLENLLKPSDIGFEWGSGRSTLWFARRVARLTSIEHDPRYYVKLRELMEQAMVGNVTYLLHTLKEDDPDNGFRQSNAYVETIDQFTSGSLDFILVDGTFRDRCAIAALDKLRPGGMLLIDNANWFLPRSTRSPGSRSVEAGAATTEWAAFLEHVARWRCIWTSNGVFDTAFWFKP